MLTCLGASRGVRAAVTRDEVDEVEVERDADRVEQWLIRLVLPEPLELAHRAPGLSAVHDAARSARRPALAVHQHAHARGAAAKSFDISGPVGSLHLLLTLLEELHALSASKPPAVSGISSRRWRTGRESCFTASATLGRS